MLPEVANYGSENPIDPEILDQDNLYGTCCIYELEYPHLYQQVVTAGTTGYLSTILLEVHESRGGGILRFSIYEGKAIPNSAPIFTEDVDLGRFAGEQYRWNVSKADFGVEPGTVLTVYPECPLPESGDETVRLVPNTSC